MRPHVDPKQTLAKNLRSLKERERLGFRAWSHRVGVGEGTLARITAGSHAANLDTLAKIADYYHLEVWQLLCPEFEPNNPPITAKVEAAQRELFDKLKNLSDLLPKT